MRGEVPRLALGAPFGRGTVRDLARDMVAIAVDGLRGRGRLDASGQDERRHLEPLQAMVAGGPTQAERALEKFATVWGGDASCALVGGAV